MLPSPPWYSVSPIQWTFCLENKLLNIIWKFQFNCCGVSMSLCLLLHALRRSQKFHLHIGSTNHESGVLLTFWKFVNKYEQTYQRRPQGDSHQIHFTMRLAYFGIGGHPISERTLCSHHLKLLWISGNPLLQISWQARGSLLLEINRVEHCEFLEIKRCS